MSFYILFLFSVTLWIRTSAFFPTTTCISLKDNQVLADKDSAVNVNFSVASSCLPAIDALLVLSKPDAKSLPQEILCQLFHSNGRCHPSIGQQSKGCYCNDETRDYSVKIHVDRDKTDGFWVFVGSKNGVDVFRESAIVTIKHPPMIKSLEVLDEAQGELGPSVPLRENSEATIICKWLEGDSPRPAQIKHNGVPLVTSTKTNEPNGEDLRHILHVIPSIRCDDAGVITCEAPGATENKSYSLAVECLTRSTEYGPWLQGMEAEQQETSSTKENNYITINVEEPREYATVHTSEFGLLHQGAIVVAIALLVSIGVAVVVHVVRRKGRRSQSSPGQDHSDTPPPPRHNFRCDPAAVEVIMQRLQIQHQHQHQHQLDLHQQRSSLDSITSDVDESAYAEVRDVSPVASNKPPSPTWSICTSASDIEGPFSPPAVFKVKVDPASCSVRAFKSAGKRRCDAIETSGDDNQASEELFPNWKDPNEEETVRPFAEQETRSEVRPEPEEDEDGYLRPSVPNEAAHNVTMATGFNEGSDSMYENIESTISRSRHVQHTMNLSDYLHPVSISKERDRLCARQGACALTETNTVIHNANQNEATGSESISANDDDYSHPVSCRERRAKKQNERERKLKGVSRMKTSMASHKKRTHQNTEQVQECTGAFTPLFTPSATTRTRQNHMCDDYLNPVASLQDEQNQTRAQSRMHAKTKSKRTVNEHSHSSRSVMSDDHYLTPITSQQDGKHPHGEQTLRKVPIHAERVATEIGAKASSFLGSRMDGSSDYLNPAASLKDGLTLSEANSAKPPTCKGTAKRHEGLPNASNTNSKERSGMSDNRELHFSQSPEVMPERDMGSPPMVPDVLPRLKYADSDVEEAIYANETSLPNSDGNGS